MPRYELMYLLGSQVAETEVPNFSAQVTKSVADFGGSNVQETNLGKKKLSFPIKKTRNGYYVVVNFEMPTNKINQLDAKIRSLDSSIIRYLIVNLEEHLERMDRDRREQALKVRKLPAEKFMDKDKKLESVKPAIKLEDIDEKMLDEQIEKALTEDLTK